MQAARKGLLNNTSVLPGLFIYNLMANKPKVGLDYFPFEVGYFNDIKIRKLIKYQGCKSIAVHTHLLCNIYKNGYYLKWDTELPFMISEDTGCEEGFINEVVKCCFDVDLFHRTTFEKFRVLTSKGIQERFAKICKDSKRKVNLTEYNIISSEDIPNSPEELPQRKGKESKEKESKEDTARVFVNVGLEKFLMPPSQLAMTESFMVRTEQTLMTSLQGINTTALWEKFDKNYTCHDFEDRNHFFASMKKIGNEILNPITKGGYKTNDTAPKSIGELKRPL